MRALIQRVKKASVTINGLEKRSIKSGLVVFIAFSYEDSIKSLEFVIGKLINLRIFADCNDKLNLSISDIGGEFLIVSNFTLYADCSHGNRPSLSKSAKSTDSLPLYNEFISMFKRNYPNDLIKVGEFGADMEVEIINDGPVTLLVEDK